MTLPRRDPASPPKADASPRARPTSTAGAGRSSATRPAPDRPGHHEDQPGRRIGGRRPGDRLPDHGRRPGRSTVTKRYRLWKGEDGFEVDLEFTADAAKDAKFAYRLFGPHGIPIEGEWYTATFRDVFFGLVKGGRRPGRDQELGRRRQGTRPIPSVLPTRSRSSSPGSRTSTSPSSSSPTRSPSPSGHAGSRRRSPFVVRENAAATAEVRRRRRDHLQADRRSARTCR